jgi:cathepsin C
MTLSLVKNGPIAVSFEVYDDFLKYSGGVYHHTGMKDKLNFGFNPFELTNHAVLLVGYGQTESGEKYWVSFW